MYQHTRSAVLYIFKRKIQIHIPSYGTNFGKFKSAHFDGNFLILNIENGAPYDACAVESQDLHGELSELGLAGVERLREQSLQTDGNAK